MTQPFKVCPQCQSPADLNAVQCLHCGRQYKTQFAGAPAADQTQMFTAPPSQPTQAFSAPTSSSNARLTKALIVLGIICACAYLFNCLQAWYVEVRVVKAKQEYDAQQEQARSEAERNAEENRRRSEQFYHNLNSMDRGIPIPQEHQENDSYGVPGVSAPMPPVRIVTQPNDPSSIHLRNGQAISRDQYERTQRALQASPQFNYGASGPPH